MNAEFKAVLEYWEKEKGISKETLVETVNEALVSAARKAVGAARELRVDINPDTGEIKAFAKLIVVNQVKSKHDEISRFDALRMCDEAKLGDEIEVEVTPSGFGRIAAQDAKQKINQLLRIEEKKMIYDEFRDRVGDIVSGTVRRFERSDVKVDLGKFEALLPNRERVPIEEYQVGERLLCYVKAVDESAYGPEIILSRADPDFVIRLFQREVSEINDGTVQIMGVAREPGFRTKLAVHSADNRVDPVGACVGLRGQRVKNIVRELNNEKVDIIRYDTDITTYVTNALAPAKLKTFDINENGKRIRIMVSEDQLSLAIGRRGQNARLTAKLTGWEIDIEAEEIETVTFDEQVAQAIAGLAAVPGIGEDLAKVLVTSGFLTVEDLKQASVEDLSGIPGLAEHAQAIYDAVQNAGVTMESPAVEEPNEAAAGSEPAAQEEQAAEEGPATEEELVTEKEPVAEETPEEPAPEAEDTPSGEPKPAEESKN